MKRNSWFVVKWEDTFEIGTLGWLSPLGKKFDKAVTADVDGPKAIATGLNVNIVEAQKRMYWRMDWKETDPLEGGSVWTLYRREAIKFQMRADAELFAFEMARLFPPYIGLIKVERLRWNPNPKGPIVYPGPYSKIALAT